MLMDPDGTDVQQLVQADSGPSWSPNGQELVYAKGAGLFVTDRSGHGYWAIPTGLSAASVSEPDWSPDGKTIVFWALEGIYHYVYTVRIDGTALTKLTATDGYRRYPIWSPNGNRIAFKDGYDVVTVRPNGRDLRRLVGKQREPWRRNRRKYQQPHVPVELAHPVRRIIRRHLTRHPVKLTDTCREQFMRVEKRLILRPDPDIAFQHKDIRDDLFLEFHCRHHLPAVH